MATDRRGRRERKRRHKSRMKEHPVRLWQWVTLGIEFAAMTEFVDQPQDRVTFIGGPSSGQLMPWQGESLWCVHVMPPMPELWRPDYKIPEPVRFTYCVKRRSEARMFYDGRIRRIRRLQPIMVPRHGI